MIIKKRVATFFLALIMMVSVAAPMPVTAFADEGDQNLTTAGELLTEVTTDDGLSGEEATDDGLSAEKVEALATLFSSNILYDGDLDFSAATVNGTNVGGSNEIILNLNSSAAVTGAKIRVEAVRYIPPYNSTGMPNGTGITGGTTLVTKEIGNFFDHYQAIPYLAADVTLDLTAGVSEYTVRLNQILDQILATTIKITLPDGSTAAVTLVGDPEVAKNVPGIDYETLVGMTPSGTTAKNNLVDAVPSEIKDTADAPQFSLAKKYEDYFLIGNLDSQNSAAPASWQSKHFNVFTAENGHKPSSLMNASGVLNLTATNTFINNAIANNSEIVGHTLLWHNQSQNAFQPGIGVTREQALVTMENYIKTVVEHFDTYVFPAGSPRAGERVFRGWDVVNEAFINEIPYVSEIDLSTSGSWKKYLRNSKQEVAGWNGAPGSGTGHSGDQANRYHWYDAFENGADTAAGESGADFIYWGFVFARRYTDAELNYNDFNIYEEGKAQMVAQMVEELNDRYAAEQPNAAHFGGLDTRPLIDVVGLQGHWYIEDTPARDPQRGVQRAIEILRPLGVRIHITELDLEVTYPHDGSWGGTNVLKNRTGAILDNQPGAEPYWRRRFSLPITSNVSADIPASLNFGKYMEAVQAEVYAEYFAVFMENADIIDRVTFWGLRDPNSWRRYASPLLWYADVSSQPNPKLSYYAVAAPEEFLGLDSIPAPEVNVHRVRMTPYKNQTVPAGYTKDFAATVYGNGNPATTVKWTVEGGSKPGTVISANGILTVAENETSKRLIVRATSTVDPSVSGTVTVKVTQPLAPGVVFDDVINYSAATVNGINVGGSNEITLNLDSSAAVTGAQIRIEAVRYIPKYNSTAMPKGTNITGGTTLKTNEIGNYFDYYQAIPYLAADVTVDLVAGASSYTVKLNQILDQTLATKISIVLPDGSETTTVVLVDEPTVAKNVPGIDYAALVELTPSAAGAKNNVTDVVPGSIKTAADDPLFSLAEKYKDYFLIGNTNSGGSTTAWAAKHFNTFTANNEHKPERLMNADGTYNLEATASVNLINAAIANNSDMVGHVLLWHNQSQNAYQPGIGATRAEALVTMENYIKTVLENFNQYVFPETSPRAGEKVFRGWDVVNEAFINEIPYVSNSDLNTPGSWKKYLRSSKQEVAGWNGAPGSGIGHSGDQANRYHWYDAFANGAKTYMGESGADFIYWGFVFARRYTDAELNYNDFNIYEEGKAQMVAQMVTELNARYATEQPNGPDSRPLIDVIGMQGHWYIQDTPARDPQRGLQRALEILRPLGVRVHITELDLFAYYPNGYDGITTPLKNRTGKFLDNFMGGEPYWRQRFNLPTNKEVPASLNFGKYIEAVQAEVFAEYFAVLMENADIIDRVTFWGLRDNNSWRSYMSPTLWYPDVNGEANPKLAYYAAANPEEFLGIDAIPAPETSVLRVRVSPSDTSSLEAGETRSFAATVYGNNNPAQDVTWTVEGGNSGTVISSDGVLTVAANEKAKQLTVRATSTADPSISCTYVVDVTAKTSGSTPSKPSSKSSGGSGGGAATGPAITASTIWIESPKALTLASDAKKAGLPYARNKSIGVTGARKAALANLKGLRFEHDTVVNGVVQVRVSISKPELAANDLMVSGRIDGSDVDRVKSTFTKWFSSNIRIIHLDQKDPWGQPVEIAARVDLNGMNTKNLFFYSYNKATNTYTRILTQYWVDKNGYLHFNTELAGDIIVSDGPLARK